MVSEKGVLVLLEQRDVSFLVLAALMAVIEEEEGDVGAPILGARAVVEADRLVGGEDVVGPAVRDQERRRGDRVVDVVRGMVRRDLVDDVIDDRVVIRLARVDPGEPRLEVGVGVGKRRRVETGDRARGVKA